MKRYRNRISLSLLLLLALLVFAVSPVLAQSYYFELVKETVNLYMNEDGTASIDYVMDFNNQPSGHAIEYVDVGMPPGGDFDTNSISADVNGIPVFDFSTSGYEGSGSGFAVGLGSESIPPGQSGTVHIFIGIVRGLVFIDSQDKNYASFEFSPSYFGSEYVTGSTDLTVSFHLPPGVKPEEPRWHAAPNGWPQEPATALDEQGRVVYTWNNPAASADKEYRFGASFPKQYVPATVVQNPSIFQLMNIDPDTAIGFLFCCGFAGFIVFIIVVSYRSTQKRKLQYLPPKVAIEGHGIKRGLTAVEAALLLEQPLDKILTMILFGVVKKGAAEVVTREPLELKFTTPAPEGLQPYEAKFLEAFKDSSKTGRRKALQDLTIDLVQSVSQKMKGFSRRETIAYYKDIINRAWTQVEAANTPEVKSQKYDEVMEWTMLDKNYGERTREVFHGGPVFVPVWWPRYDPAYGRSIPTSAPSTPGGGLQLPSLPSAGSLPHLPGSDFAASIVNGVQNFSSNVIGNLSDFTGNVTQKTNPVPVTTTTSSRSGSGRAGGGCACACACACAGCACACAGGGR